MEKTFTGFSRKNIKNIHALSLEYNKLKNKEHVQVLLDLAGKHVQEIKQLYKAKDKHYIVETGDLLILCLELLEEAKADSNLVIEKCYKRYYKKLFELIKRSK